MTDNKDQIIAALKNQVLELEKTATHLAELYTIADEAINSLKDYYVNTRKVLTQLKLSNNSAINAKLETKLVEVDESDIPPSAPPSAPPTSKPPSAPPTSKPPSAPPTSKPPK